MSFIAGLVDFIKVKIFGTRKRMCACDMRAMYRWGIWAQCRLCYRIFSWVPVLFILGVVCWSYYAFVYVVTFTVIEDVWLRLLYLVLYHAALVPFLWSYYQIVFRNPGDVPVNFRLSLEACERMQTMGSINEQNRFLNEVARGLPLMTRSFDDNVRFCDICAQIKPDRAHHCSVCGKCVLKMDHHCPWVNNCVGYANYKFFIQFLLYALVLCVVIGVSVLPHFIAFWQRSGLSDGGLDGPGFGSRFNILFLFFVAVMFAISVSILLSYHLHLVSRNRTTLESFRPPVLSSGPDKKAFDLGCYRNIEQVFGTRKLLWVVPITTCLGDGVAFPMRSGLRGTTYAAVEEGTRNPLDDGTGGGDAASLGVQRFTSSYMSNGGSGPPSSVDYSLRGVVVDPSRK